MRVEKHKSFCSGILLVLLAAFYLFHFDFLEVPSADYIGNFRSFVLRLMRGGLDAVPNKVLPLYPLILAGVTRLTGWYGRDALYTNALMLNFLFMPVYAVSVYSIYRKLFGKESSFWALTTLLLNSFSLYMVINAELEMFHAAVSALAFVLMIRHERLAALFVSVTSLVKWNAVFIIPAYLRKLSGQSRSYIGALLWGALAAVPFALWFVVRIILSDGNNTYVSEIARRGPNIVRFPIDAFLVLTGFLQWGAIDIYETGLSPYSVAAGLLLVSAALLFIVLFILGLISLCKRRNAFIDALAIYTAGYFLVHMIYQNSKSRYVLPLLWILHLVLFEGARIAYSRLTQQKEKDHAVTRLISSNTVTGAVVLSTGFSFLLVFQLNVPLVTVFLILFSVVVLVYLCAGRSKNRLHVVAASFLLCIAALNICYGRSMLNHYSLRRVEFKEVSLYLNQHAGAEGKILVSERNVIRYYSNLKNMRFVTTSGLQSNTLDELYDELRAKKIRYVYIDDFYIRRLKMNDQNAFDRNAVLLKKLRDTAQDSDRYSLLTQIEVSDEITGYLYRVNNESGQRMK